jgi:hypothetical protein
MKIKGMQPQGCFYFGFFPFCLPNRKTAQAGRKGRLAVGCSFSDLDGHRWNALYMDMSKMPEG